ncbi:MAG: quinol dehydrogenase ferredoxin subunit NapH [Candidatus Electrothrix sp. ATG1]|nr:quinol dehydrogenase ferredoxin subunit NapH [Candidatus Electrothrix sp. ATG1]MCI5208503.1 quinol dehydrogenase ferredoxin subunit NapH [Candidatus Electrothrix sp. ATG2]
MSIKSRRIPGREAVLKKGWLATNKWLLLRRLSQVGILGLFLTGPLAGIWIITGTLAASETLGFLPLTDPLILLQSVVAGHTVTATTVVGALIVVVFYAMIGGRVFCAWVCPVNLLTDTAAWLHRRSGLRQGVMLSSNIRYWFMAMILVLAACTGSIVWEQLNPVTMFQRGLIFGGLVGGIGAGWLLLVAVFLFDAFVVRRGWCGHLCPVGAAYSLLGFASVLRVKAEKREQCTDCMDCFTVCPEPQVIRPALKAEEGGSSVILSNNCLNCGRCIDICPHNIFRFSQRT